VSELSRELGRPMVNGQTCPDGVGIEAGLFACIGGTIFDRLATLAESKDYHTITDAIQELADSGCVASMSTGGRKWVAVETTEELEESRSSQMIQRSRSNSDVSPTALTDLSASPPAFLHEPVPVFFIAGGTAPNSRASSKTSLHQQK